MISLCCLLLLTPPPVVDQATLIVDGADPNAQYHSITAAMNLAIAGDTVVVRGLKVGAMPVPYSDIVLTAQFPVQQAEVFPLAMKEGVTLKPGNSNPVLIYQAVPSGFALIEIAAGGAAGLTTTIKGMRLVGGAIGIDAALVAASTAGARTLKVENSRFIRNVIGLSAVLKKGQALTLDMANCVFEPTTMMFGSLPSGYRTPTHGIRLHALEESENLIPRIDATLTGLSLAPAYPATEATDFLQHAEVQVIGNTGKISRFLEVHARGILGEHRAVLPVRSPVAEVVVNLNGGSFNNQDSSWDAFFYGATRCQSEADLLADHACGYVVTLTGATIQKFRQFGAYATADRNARGELRLYGDTLVKETGLGESRTRGLSHFSGVHGFAHQGYLAILGEDFDSSNNLGHGLFMTAHETKMTPGEHPVGAYLGITDARFHQNGGAGISLLNAYNEYGGGLAAHGVTGGTWHERGGYLTLIADGSDLTHLEHGQGVMDRCAISNNGEHGIIYRNHDRALPSAPSAINVRVTNSAIWNNPLGGVVASSDVQEVPHTTYMICPIILSTIAGNGSSSAVDPFSGQVADYNVEYFELQDSNHQTEYIYEFTDPILVPQTTIGTRFSNLILQRQVPGVGVNDFGPYSQSSELAPDPGDPALIADHLIGVAAIRADGPSVALFPRSTSDLSPFSGPMNWTDVSPAKFQLTGSGANNIFSKTWEFLLTGLSEAMHDYLNVTRDPLRDIPMPAAEKGAFERPNAP